MVLRAHFFLMAWRSHIVAHPAYSVHIQYISRESFDIFLTLCDSLIALIILYRQYYPEYPLLPWNHSTEAIEHIYGILCQLKKDFTYIDMLYFESKMRVLLGGAFNSLTAEEQANQTAAGYFHTYFIAPDLDLVALVQWPTDIEINEASTVAYNQAKDILSIVGVDCYDMLKDHWKEPLRQSKASIQKSKSQHSVSSPHGPRTLSELIELYRNDPHKPSKLTTKDEEELEACEAAIIADNIDGTMKMYVSVFSMYCLIL